MNLSQIRSSVIINWLKRYDVRKVQHMIGHKYVSSTEKFQQNDLKELQDARLINIILDGKKSRYEINWHSWKDYTTSLTQFMDFVNNPADHSL